MSLTKWLYTSDIHASHTHLFSMLSVSEKEEVDGIIIGGDIVPHELPGSSKKDPIHAQASYLKDVFMPAIRTFQQDRDTAIYLDFGNDDFIANRHMLEEQSKEAIRLLHHSKYALTDSVDIIGYMIVPPTPFGLKDWEKPDSIEVPYAPGQQIAIKGYISNTGLLEEIVLDLESEDTIENDLKRLSEGIDRPFIFISHAPPHDTALDVIYNGLNVGSMSIRRFIETWSEKGLLMASFHGHIHESPNRTGSIYTKIENAWCINPGQGNGIESPFRYVTFTLLNDEIWLDLE